MKKLLPVLLLMSQPAFAVLTATDVSALTNSSNSLVNRWDIFEHPHTDPNIPDVIDHGAVLTQVNTGAIQTSGGNLYSHSGKLDVTIADENISYVDAANGLYVGNVVLELKTLGTQPNFNSFVLTYKDELGIEHEAQIYGGKQSYTSDEFTMEGQTGTSYQGAVAFQWDLTGLDAVSYQIRFESLGTFMSIDTVALYSLGADTAFFAVTEAIPEPSSALLGLVGVALAGGLCRRARCS